MSDEKTKSVKIVNDLGLHLRAAGVFVQVASNYDAEIWLEYNGQRANAKSIMSVLALAASCGAEIKMLGEGYDAEAALDALALLIENKFQE